MPTSAVELIPPVIAAVRECSELYGVSTILDAGCGAGLYGALLRQYLDHAHNRFATSGEKGMVHLAGVEPCARYDNPNHEHYDEFHHQDVQSFLTDIGTGPARTWDVVLALDLLEHLPLDEAQQVMRALHGLTEKYLIISSPMTFREQWQPQQPWEDARQEHRCLLTPEMVTAAFPRLRLERLGRVWMAVVRQENLQIRHC